jgi:hypothetical protein
MKSPWLKIRAMLLDFFGLENLLDEVLESIDRG